jgi:hypothetical protein
VAVVLLLTLVLSASALVIVTTAAAAAAVSLQRRALMHNHGALLEAQLQLAKHQVCVVIILIQVCVIH